MSDMSQSPAISSRVGAILRSTGGNFLEMFDFFLFGFYASYIAKAFFPTVNEVNGLLLTFTTFWSIRRGLKRFPAKELAVEPPAPLHVRRPEVRPTR